MLEAKFIESYDYCGKDLPKWKCTMVASSVRTVLSESKIRKTDFAVVKLTWCIGVNGRAMALAQAAHRRSYHRRYRCTRRYRQTVERADQILHGQDTV